LRRLTRGLLPLVALILFLALNAVIFRTPLYPRVLSPASSTYAFDDGLRRVAAASTDRDRDVLVLGDSRIFGGLDEATADAAAPGLRIINGAVSGTTPRCWYVFDRAADPDASRYRAIVIPVDTEADDDSALGSVDGDNRAFDLRYIVFRTGWSDVWKIGTSFQTPDGRLQSLVDLTLRGPILREDAQAFLGDPAARFAALAAGPPPELTPHLRTGSLAGLRVDFDHDTVTLPPGSPEAGDPQLDEQLLHRPQPSAAEATYRREWLGPIVARYAAAGVPVIFVRIPTRPLHRAAPAPLSGTLRDLVVHGGAVALPQAPYVALEQPQYFVDADHLNAAGARRFSTLLGADLARVLHARRAARIVVPARPERPGRAWARDDAGAAAALPPAVDDGAPARTAPAAMPMFGTPIRFQSYEFVIFFLAAVTVYYLVLVRPLRLALLLAASWYFYARWNAWYLAVLLALTATDYLFGRIIASGSLARRRAALVAGVSANLAFLGTFKYADFVSGSVAALLRVPGDPWALHLLVPVGISFHTFQSISYLVDVARGKVRAMRNPFDYALYLAFFPQLLAGPIVRAGRFAHEWSRVPHLTWPHGADLVAGGWQIALGFFKKGVIADRFAAISDGYFGAVTAHPGTLTAWSAAFAFTMQIYFDFSGYSDIAIGCARVFGFRFPANFRRPYLAWSPTEFWRRWHMTLSRWLRDYLYIPLGGNRHGEAATARNLMLTMLLGGLWHGAGWTFVAWGAYHGALLVGERILGLRAWNDRARAQPLARIAGTIVTFLLVLAGWVLFRSPSFGTAATILRTMVSGSAGPSLVGAAVLLLVGIVFAVEIWTESGRAQLARLPLVVQGAAVALVLFGLEIGTYPGTAAPFIYFKF
jgi:alginate O-acetyltransferase complex protein AlgI